MFHRSSGGTGFSFNRLITNVIPNFANDNPNQDADLTRTEKDMLWTYQVPGAESRGKQPMTLDVGSAMRAGVTTSDKISSRIHKELVKNGVLNPDTPLGIDTTRITPKFAHQLSFISIAGQRKVIGMVFFWEEEAIRWRLLNQEEEEIKAAMDGDDLEEEAKEELGLKLQALRMRKAMRPSERLQESSGNNNHQSVAPPRYS